MDDRKTEIAWKRLFLAIVLTVCGVFIIVSTASQLDGYSIAVIISGIPLVMLGSWFFMESIETIRRANKETKGTKD